VYLLNVRPNEAETYKEIHDNTELLNEKNLAESLARVTKNSYVIVEDLICVSHKEEEAIRMILNYRAHHDNLRVICIGHMLYRTHLLTLVPLFNFIVFTLVNASRGLLKTAATFGFHLDKEETRQWVTDFSQRCSTAGRGDFMFIECNSITLYHSSSSSEVVKRDEGKLKKKRTSSRSDTQSPALSSPPKVVKPSASADTSSASSGPTLEQRFASCFIGQSNRHLAAAFFSIIVKILREQTSFREYDLSLAFDTARKPGCLKRISVVDYACALLNENAGVPPSKDHLVLHRFLSERCKIPTLFIRNPHFWPTTCDVSSDESIGEDEQS